MMELALAIVFGTDAADAFANGRKGEGIPLFKWSELDRASPLLWSRCSTKEEQQAWVSSFFVQQNSWRRPDTARLSERYGDWLAHRKSRDRGVLELLLHASLSGPHEAPCSPEAYLAEPHFVTDPAAKAIALLLMRELKDDEAGYFELLSAEGATQKTFLFFGLRAIQ